MEEQFFDERTREELDPEKAAAARMEEVGFMKNIHLYDEKDVAESWQVTRKAPISTKWVGSRKGHLVRMRLVARDFKPKGENNRDSFAPAGGKESAVPHGRCPEAEVEDSKASKK